MALADLFAKLADKYPLRLVIAHFEHGIRKTASLEDARFAENFCKEHKLPFRLGQGDVPAFAAKWRLSIETAARKLRYSFLRELKVELALDYIAVAHHAGDQAETVLMRLLRGSGVWGLAAMRPIAGDIVRPFLAVPKATLVAYCHGCGLSPRHDATNDIADTTRNCLRLELLPKLSREYNRDIESILCQTADMAAAETDFLKGAADKLWPEAMRITGSTSELNAAFLRNQPVAMQRELLRRFIRENRGNLKDIGFRQLEDIRRLLWSGTGKSLPLPGGLSVVLSYEWLKIATPSKDSLPAITLKFPGTTELYAYGLSITTGFSDAFPAETGSDEFYGALEKLQLPLVVRTRRLGDRIKLHHGTVKLKDFFINAKIPREERDSLPLLAMGDSGDDVLWLMGLRRSVLTKPNADTTNYFYIKFSKKGEFYDDGNAQ